MEFPVHFLTIVLNGMPFIRYHIDVFNQLRFPWHWHIVEGVSALTKDTAWSVARGGRIPEFLHRCGLSVDGTTEYLDGLRRDFPGRVSVYRKPAGEFWDGKVEMVNAPLGPIAEECLLWQVDADELWTADQLGRTRELFCQHPEKTAAYYWCWFFVGPDMVVSSRHCYSQNPRSEWLRTWRFRPGMHWRAHEPPTLVHSPDNSHPQNAVQMDPFRHDETEAAGLVFQHFAYATFPQLVFKQEYYGYANAVHEWIALQQHDRFPTQLGSFFSWVRDATTVDRAASLGVRPLARGTPTSPHWQFSA
jgi:hypothetical protein